MKPDKFMQNLGHSQQTLAKVKNLVNSARYIFSCKGENGPQTPAHFFSCATGDPLGLDQFEVIEGAEPSLINLTDIDRALQTLTHIAAALLKFSDADPYISVAVKHGNACGASVSGVRDNRIKKTIFGDGTAVKGSFLMTNFALTDEDGVALRNEVDGKRFTYDGIIAPSISEKTRELNRRKNGRCRFIVNDALETLSLESLDTAPRIRHVRGGFLTEPNYEYVFDFKHPELKLYGPEATLQQKLDLLLAWAVCATSNSNTITLADNGMIIGNGTGQQDRVFAAKQAIARALRSEHELLSAVAVSDSFFPFPDGPLALIEAGIKVILTTSGSERDQETIDVCEKNGVTLYMIPDSIGRGFAWH